MPCRRLQCIRQLVDDIRERGNALSAGDIGYRYVLKELAECGRSDVIFDMNSRSDVPGYGWQLAHGATSLTESWQAYGFVSNNHFMLGHLMEWLYAYLGGIRQTDTSVGYKELLFDPQMVGDVNEAEASYETPYGRAACHWKRDDRGIQMWVTVPENSTAQVMLPAGAMLTSILVGWFASKAIVREEFTNWETSNSKSFFNVYLFCVRYIVPTCILLILMHQFGVI